MRLQTDRRNESSRSHWSLFRLTEEFGHASVAISLSMFGQHIGQATLALALLAALVTGLLLGGRWFRANSSRISAQISLVAERIGSSDTLQRLRQRHPQAWEFVIRRFAPGEYLGLHLTIGLIVSIVALWVFIGTPAHVVVKKDSRVEILAGKVQVTWEEGKDAIRLGVADDIWVKVRIDGKEGWIHSEEDLQAVGLYRAG